MNADAISESAMTTPIMMSSMLLLLGDLPLMTSIEAASIEEILFRAIGFFQRACCREAVDSSFIEKKLLHLSRAFRNVSSRRRHF